MATIDGTIRSISILESSASLGAPGAERTALVVCDFGAYTGASDDARIPALATAIQNRIRNGKTVTLRQGMCTSPGRDTNAQAIYTSNGTNSSGALVFNLAQVDRTTELTSATASTNVCMHVVFTES